MKEGVKNDSKPNQKVKKSGDSNSEIIYVFWENIQ